MFSYFKDVVLLVQCAKFCKPLQVCPSITNPLLLAQTAVHNSNRSCFMHLSTLLASLAFHTGWIVVVLTFVVTSEVSLTIKMKAHTWQLIAEKMTTHENNVYPSVTFICSFPDCKASYNKVWKLEAHLCKHTGEVSSQHVTEDCVINPYK